MKNEPSSLKHNNLPKNYYSKQLTKYDCELTFDKKLKHFLRVHKKSKIFNSKELKTIFNQKSKDNEDDFNRIKSKINVSQKNQNLNKFSPLNELAKQKRISYLPKISPYILNNKNSILIDYNKASEMGSEGFRYFCDNENKNIKDILFAYNDHNFKSLKDYNSFSYFNKVNENLGYSNMNNNDFIHKLNNKNEVEKNRNNTAHTINHDLIEEDNKNNFSDNFSRNNIFDDNFMKKNKYSKIKRKLLKKIERIKNQNHKVIELYNQHKKTNLKRKMDNRIYRINYNSIEKHTPYTILSSKSQRLSPEDMVHSNFTTVYHKKKITFGKEIKPKEETSERFFLTNRSINLCSGKYDFSL